MEIRGVLTCFSSYFAYSYIIESANKAQIYTHIEYSDITAIFEQFKTHVMCDLISIEYFTLPQSFMLSSPVNMIIRFGGKSKSFSVTNH